MSNNTPELSERILEILAALQRKEVEDRRHAIFQAERRIELLKEKMNILQIEYESLEENINETQSRLVDAKRILELGNQAHQLQTSVSNSPELSPVQFYRDLGIIDRGITRANAVVQNSNESLQQQIPQKILLKSRIDTARKQAEDFTEKNVEDQERLNFLEPMVEKIDSLVLELEKEREERPGTISSSLNEEMVTKEADSAQIARATVELEERKE